MEATMSEGSPQLLILSTDPPSEDPRYRGVQRRDPFFMHHYPQDHPTNQLFLVYMNKIYNTSTLDDLHLGRELVRVYAEEGYSFELVNVSKTDGDALAGHFIGYDVITNMRHSFLVNGLKYYPEQRGLVIDPLIDLMYQYFVPRLNEYLLFADRKTADLFLRCATALQKLIPNLWEGDEVLDSFMVLGLWVVT
jgi:hypothetical protein